MQKRTKNMLCISLRMPIKEEHYHLRSTHTQHKENQEYKREEKQTNIIVPFDYKTHTHTHNCLQKKREDTNMLRDREKKTF